VVAAQDNRCGGVATHQLEQAVGDAVAGDGQGTTAERRQFLLDPRGDALGAALEHQARVIAEHVVGVGNDMHPQWAGLQTRG
jgi:hypothetical protein